MIINCMIVMCLFRLLNVVNAVNGIGSIRGVSPMDSVKYNIEKGASVFWCFDKSRSIPITAINDNFCDCPDGSDEPGTSACPNSKFYCHNKGYLGGYISANFVNDGICDCCDGSDEYDLQTGKSRCKVNNCDSLNRARLKRLVEDSRTASRGFEERKKLVGSAGQWREKTSRNILESKSKVETLKKQVDALKEKRDALKEQRKMAKKLKSNLPRIRSRQVKELRGIFRHLKADKGSVDDALKMYDEFEKKYETLDIIEKGNIPPVVPKNDDISQETGDPIVEYEETVLGKPEFEDGEVNDDADDVDEAIIDAKEDLAGSDWISQVTSKIYGTVGSILGSKRDLKSQNGEDGETAEELLEAVATEKEVEAISKEYNEKERELTRLSDSISSDEKKLETDYGPDDVFFHMLDQCYQYETSEYTYELCPFTDVHQKPKSGGTSQVSMGKWSKWANDYHEMVFDKGLKCWNGPDRSVLVHLKCGTKNVITSVTEPNMCEYEMIFETPAVCRETILEDANVKKGSNNISYFHNYMAASHLEL